MKLRRRRSTTGIALGLTLVSLLGILAVIPGIFVKPTLADTQSGRLLSVYDRGEEKVFISEAKTVGDALNEAGFELDPRDAVEPARDETLVASDYRINIYRARPVTVVDGALRQKVISPYQTVERIIADADIELYAEDNATLTRSEDIVTDGAGLQVEIDRATPLTLDQFGKQITVRTQATTVADFLKEKAITLTASDRVTPDRSTRIEEGMTIRIWREGKQTITVDEAVPFTTDQIQDADRPLGYKEVKTAGKDGKRSVTYEIDVQNGVEVSRTEIATVETVPAEPQVEVVGAKATVNVVVSSEKAAIMSAGGVAIDDQQYAAYIINNENAGWCAIRWQGTRGCAASYYVPFDGAETSSQIGYGLCQATPGSKMASAGGDWRENVVTQMKWCHSYAIGRYGSWEAAYNFKVARGWW